MLLNEYDKKFFGVYPAKCVDNSDPDTKYRIKVKIPQISGDAVSNWAFPCTPVSANRASLVPALNSTVWVMFVGGDPNFPVWIGVL